MDIRLIEQRVEELQCDALVLGVSYKKVGQQRKDLLLTEEAKEVDSLLGGLIQTIFEDGEFKGELGEIVTLHPLNKLAAKRIIVMGLGSQEKMECTINSSC